MNLSYSQSQWLFSAFTALLITCAFVGVAMEWYWLIGIPVFLLLAYQTIVDFRKIFYLLVFCLPFSIEYRFSNGLGTDLPSEPLMIGLAGVTVFYFFQNIKQQGIAFLKHPITVILLLHIFWIFFTMLNSQNFLISLKFFLAKSWYVITFYFLAGIILNTTNDIKTYIWCLFIPMSVMIFIAIARHASYGFSFTDVNFALSPFYRNHVNYASIISLIFPYLWFARSWYKAAPFKWWALLLGAVLFLVAIQLSYTRAAYVGIVAAAGSFFMFRWRLTRLAAVLTVIIGIIGIIYLYKNNRYLDYAPNYEKAITQLHFDNLLEATYTGEDVSTMERVYRWVAGARMIEAHPIVGVGPGNFYTFYKNYTVTMFKTYVSDNPEQSGVHSYFLMTTIEQGIIGLLIFLTMVFLTLIKGEDIYHQLVDVNEKKIVMMLLQSYIVIICLLLINDMIETDKVGPFFFMNMAMLVNIDLLNRKKINIQ